MSDAHYVIADKSKLPGEALSMNFGTSEVRITPDVVKDLKLKSALDRLGKALCNQHGAPAIYFAGIRFGFVYDIPKDGPLAKEIA